MLDLGRLRALHAVAAHGTITRAAAALGYTPSAVSQQIAKLERETRTDLLDRQAGRVTPSGQALAQAASEVFAILERAEADLEERRGIPHGEVVLAAFPTACRGFVAEAVAELVQRYEGLECRLVEIDPTRAVAMVAQGEVDLAVVHDWDNAPLDLPTSLAEAAIGEDFADIVLPGGHRLADREVLVSEDLADERWISQGPGAMCHRWLLETFGAQATIAFQMEEYASQLALLRAGVGVALLPRLGRPELPPGVRAVPLRPAPARRVTAVWRRRSGQRPAIVVALDALRGHWGR
ncbi:LysR family transcriptional regulator [Streptomyces sp. SPB162]|uniref:LysR family transcriptional regulator n=1 Tax=Streptomyces sp. SPB162 TaxID=2940560 RepID=UPI002404B3C5|nr:LysR family transcriptional regulator [Streptomyces sp. SPB162]MDF9817047.1 DNA-binding transcriptional LysR family regulator [Streptomyces sp. SPB162]